MEKEQRIIIIGAGIFGLSTARQLAIEGYQNITILDRHMPPVPDGSSSDISRVVRFDYADEEYMKLAYRAYLGWSTPRYKGIFNKTPYVLVGDKNGKSATWIEKAQAVLRKHDQPWYNLDDNAETIERYPELSHQLASPTFHGYANEQAGWADAGKAVIQLRDDCLQMGISFVCGPRGTVTRFNSNSEGVIGSVETLSGTAVEGDHFILAAGAWVSNIVPMYNSVLAAAQVVAYTPLSEAEVAKYKNLPMYSNPFTGWFNFPPHEDTKILKMAIHGWGYTRAVLKNETSSDPDCASLPPLVSPRQRVNYCPDDGERRLRDGLRQFLPELADRPFEKLAMCWYTDSPTGDFIMDYYPDYKNLFIGGAGSGHAFKFLPVLGECMSQAIKKCLPEALSTRWRFRKEYAGRSDAFAGDGSRGGPKRRELTSQELGRLSSEARGKL